MARIELTHVTKRWGGFYAVDDLDLLIEDNAFVTLLGPSGCGKTTTLRMIAGLETPTTGRITIDDTVVFDSDAGINIPANKRRVGFLFQNYALWPNMTVFQNIAFGLSNIKEPGLSVTPEGEIIRNPDAEGPARKLTKDEIKRIVARVSAIVKIQPFMDRYPGELSGGQQQRVAIARTLAPGPKVLFMDEPLSNLDAKLRTDMRAELKRLHKELGTTIIYVTHDQVEALTMSTKIALFENGKLSQVDKPMELYLNPNNLRNADFIGNPKTNFVDAVGEVKDGRLFVESPIGKFDFNSKYFTKEEIPSGKFDVVLGVRPEQIVLHEDNSGHAEGHIYSVQPSGSETLVQVKVNDEILLVKEIGLKRYQEDQKVSLTVHTHLMTVYNKETGRLIKFAIETEEDLNQ